MKKRKRLTAVLAVLFSLALSLQVSAADNTVEFKGEAEKFVTEIKGDSFEGLIPGEARTMTLEVKNADSSEMKFYMSAEILTNIAESGNKEAVYDFDIAKDGEVFFQTIIGGETKNNISMGKELLTENNNILLDTLKKGESSTITIRLTLDGDSTDSSYMGEEGSIKLVFSVGTAEVQNETVVKKAIKYVKGAGKTVIQSIQTGDALPIGLIAAALCSLICIIGLIVIKKKKNGREGA